jgi:uncharacterized membrane protein
VSSVVSLTMVQGAMKRLKTLCLYLLSFAMTAVGVLHFVDPAPFMDIVPDYLPAPKALVLISGFFEILGGLGLLPKATRRAAGIGLVLLYIAVFPANLYSAMYHIAPGGAEISPVMLWVRLPFQLLFIAWALWVSKEENK